MRDKINNLDSNDFRLILMIILLGCSLVFSLDPAYTAETDSPEAPLDQITSALDQLDQSQAKSKDSALEVTAPAVTVSDEELSAEQSPEKVQPETAAAKNISSANKSAMLDVLDLKNMDVADVLKLISQKSGLNIVAGQNVTGRITIYLRDIEVEEALRIILEAYGWAYVREGNVIKVMAAKDFETKYGYKFGSELKTKIKQLLFAKSTDLLNLLNQVKSETGKIIADEKSNSLILVDIPKKLDEMEMIVKKLDVPVTTEIFQLSYAKAADIAANITEVLTPAIGKVKSDERSNKIFITDTAAKIKEISKIIEAFDQKQTEVLIEAKIFQILLSDEYKWGVDWEGIVQNYHKLDIISKFGIFSDTDTKGRIAIGSIDSGDGYKALIEALDAVGTTNILSSPRIAVLNNQEAKILVGSTEPYVTTTTTTPSTGTPTTAESVNFIDVGVKLNVTPTIHQDNFITMKIKPEVSSVTSTLTTATQNTIPIVETSEAETTVTVKDGVTIVIGGLIKQEKILSTSKVPLLGDIPLVGMAFKSQKDKIKNTEIAIFLTPHIVSGDVPENVANVNFNSLSTKNR